MMRREAAYYNEIDPFAAEWLRELIKAGLIADGEVDTRSIVDVRPADVRGFTQCHFFAGIGGWSYALRLAGWDDARECWTGSCPCQPWSMAGDGKGTDDPRHLWPAWFRLIQECRPATIFGEQTSSEDGRYWLDLVYVDLEGVDYALGAADLCAASVQAPHGRSRLWFVADTDREVGRAVGGRADAGTNGRRYVGRRGDASGLADHAGSRRSRRRTGQAHEGPIESGRLRPARGVDDASSPERWTEAQGREDDGHGADTGRDQAAGRQRLAGALGGFWRDAEWIYHRDDKWRPVEPGSFPLAARVPARVGRLRGYGNAIVPQVAQAFIAAYMDVSA